MSDNKITCDCKSANGEEREDCTYPDCQTFSNAVVVVHLTPKIDENCQHEWPQDQPADHDRCTRCKISFARYVHSIF